MSAGEAIEMTADRAAAREQPTTVRTRSNSRRSSPVNAASRDFEPHRQRCITFAYKP